MEDENAGRHRNIKIQIFNDTVEAGAKQRGPGQNNSACCLRLFFVCRFEKNELNYKCVRRNITNHHKTAALDGG
jgi:hypothetical protein